MKAIMYSQKQIIWRKTTILITILIAHCLVSIGCKPKAQNETRLSVGWQTAWATAGQIIETLDHTNITDLYGSKATFRNFLFGPDMLEAGLAGDIDGTTLGVVPVISLLAMSDDWTVVCRLMDWNTHTLARTESGITTFSDIKGKRLGVPFGASGAYPYILQRMKENGLTEENTRLINVTPAEAVLVFQQGGIDAFGSWEPNTSIIVEKGLGKVIDKKQYVGFVMVRKSIVDNNPNEVIAFLKSIVEANWYVACNRDQTDEWFARRSNFDRELLKKIDIIEPNLSAKSIEDISIEISPEDITLAQQVADQMFESGLLKRKVDFASRVNHNLAKAAESDIKRDGSTSANIRIKNK